VLACVVAQLADCDNRAATQHRNRQQQQTQKQHPAPWQARPLPASRDKLSSLILSTSAQKNQEDPFTLLNNDELRRDFLFDDDLTLKQRRAQSSEVILPVLIDVKLVGFDTDDDLSLLPVCLPSGSVISM